MDIKNHNFRFNVEKEMDKKAWDIVHSDEVRNEFKSQNEFVIRAIIDFYEKQMLLKDDPYLESREKEDEFVDRIVSSVEQKVLSNIPALTGIYLSMMQGMIPGINSGAGISGVGMVGAGMSGAVPGAIAGNLVPGVMLAGMNGTVNMAEGSDNNEMDDEEEDNEFLNLNLFGDNI